MTEPPSQYNGLANPEVHTARGRERAKALNAATRLVYIPSAYALFPGTSPLSPGRRCNGEWQVGEASGKPCGSF